MSFFQPIARTFYLIAILMVIALLPKEGRGGEPIRIVAFGDSLTAGLGLSVDDAFPAKLEAALRERGADVAITNAGVSGDTTTGGLARLDWTLSGPVDGVILELGANDALRGIDPAIARAALDEILIRLKDRDISILLTGMLAPPNMGPEYGATFNTIYPDLSDLHDVLLYPFFLDGVAGSPRLNQPDGLHPTADGVDEIVTRILPSVEKLIVQIEARR
jgi:acyl-CoA thioesterase I